MLGREGIFLKKAYGLACAGAIAAGCALHFLFDCCPNPLTALLSPVSESVWEHLKLIFWPMLLAAAVLRLNSDRPLALWSGFLCAQLFAPALLLSLYYLLRCGFGVTGLALDIALYVAVMAGGFRLAAAVEQRPGAARLGAVLVLPVILYGIALILFTFAPPDAAMFRIA